MIIVSKKIARLAVTRNRIKRRVRAALRSLDLPTKVVIFPRAEVKDMQYDEMRTELKELLL